MPLKGYIDGPATDPVEIERAAQLQPATRREVIKVLATGGDVGSLTEKVSGFAGQMWQDARGASPMLSPAQIKEKYDLDVDRPMTDRTAAYRKKNRLDEAYRQDVLSRNDSVKPAEAFAWSILGGVIDPASMAINFIPVGGQIRAGSMAGKAGLSSRMAYGARAGAQGGLYSGGLTYGLSQYEGRTAYGLDDAAIDVVAGSVFGASVEGVGYGFGAARRAADANTPKGKITSQIRQTAQRYGISPELAIRVGEIESGLDPNAKNPNSSAAGVYQFLDSIWEGLGGGNKFDAGLNIERGIKMMADNKAALTTALGRVPTDGEIYLAHQQGLGGAKALLRAPSRRAVDVLAALTERGKPIGIKAASERIRLNGGHIDMTAGEFADLWAAKIGSPPSGSAGVPPASQGDITVRAPEPIRMMDEIDRAGGFAKAVDDLSDSNSVDVSELVERAVREPRAKSYLNEADVNLKVPARVYDEDVAVTARGTEFPVRYALIEARDLIASHDDDLVRNLSYPDEMQPRDRGRAGSQARLLRLESEFNPKRVMNAVEAETGAPIIGPDGVVESGNGRVIVIRRNAETGSEIYQRYRDELKAQGYDPAGMTAPVLVRVRQQAMTGPERVRLTREMNADTAERYSASEHAFVDAAAITPDDVGLYQGGAITAARNDPFSRAFVSKAGAGQENALIDPVTRKFSQEGIERMKAAMVARAFQDRNLVHAIFESSDPKIKSIGDALTDVAPVWAKMRGMAARGDLAAGADTTPALSEAINLVRYARDNRLNLGETIAQRREQLDMFAQKKRAGFDAWFKGSKVVDDNGQPLRVFHGAPVEIVGFDKAKLGTSTKARSARQGFFFVNDPAVASQYARAADDGSPKTPEGQALYENEVEPLNKAYMQSLRDGDTKRTEHLYAELERVGDEITGFELQGSNVIPVYLNLKNPLIYDFKGEEFREQSYNAIILQAKDAGHDGVIFKNTHDEYFNNEDLAAHDVYVAFENTQMKSVFSQRDQVDPESGLLIDDPVFEQPDITALSPEAHEYLRLMYRDEEFTVQRRSADIAADLSDIAEAAMRSSSEPDLFGDVINFDVAAQIDVIRARQAREGTGYVEQYDAGDGDAGNGGWVTGDSRETGSNAGEFGLISIERNSGERPGSRQPVDEGRRAAQPGSEVEAAVKAPPFEISDPEVLALQGEIRTLKASGSNIPVSAFEDPGVITEAVRAAAFCLSEGVM